MIAVVTVVATAMITVIATMITVIAAMITVVAMIATTVVTTISIVAVPVIPVPFIVTITNNRLIMAATISRITLPVDVISRPWITSVNNYFITVIKIIIAVPIGQTTPVYPYIIFQVNILMSIHIIISVNIGHVIIISMVVTYGAPIGLASDVYSYAKTQLSLSIFK
jgi:hypothetical protein